MIIRIYFLNGDRVRNVHSIDRQADDWRQTGEQADDAFCHAGE